MKNLTFTVIAAITALTITSCGGSHEANAEGFSGIEKDIKSKFGENAYFTDLTISHDESIGNIISLTTTDAPESLQMGEWTYINSAWTQNSEVTLELPEGTEATDFMYQLNDKINLKTLGDLVEKSMEKLKADKGIEDPKLTMAFIKFPDNGDISKADYTVMLQPKNGGTTFTYSYELDGTFKDMSY